VVRVAREMVRKGWGSKKPQVTGRGGRRLGKYQARPNFRTFCPEIVLMEVQKGAQVAHPLCLGSGPRPKNSRDGLSNQPIRVAGERPFPCFRQRIGNLPTFLCHWAFSVETELALLTARRRR
jgi:hypothetical protein